MHCVFDNYRVTFKSTFHLRLIWLEKSDQASCVPTRCRVSHSSKLYSDTGHLEVWLKPYGTNDSLNQHLILQSLRSCYHGWNVFDGATLCERASFHLEKFAYQTEPHSRQNRNLNRTFYGDLTLYVKNRRDYFLRWMWRLSTAITSIRKHNI